MFRRAETVASTGRGRIFCHTDGMVWWVVGILVVWFLLALVAGLRIGKILRALRQDDEDDQ
jgi:hypothetical protein